MGRREINALLLPERLGTSRAVRRVTFPTSSVFQVVIQLAYMCLRPA